ATGGTLVVNDSAITTATLTGGSGGTGGTGGGSGASNGGNGNAGAASGQSLYLAANATLSVDATTSPAGVTYAGTISRTGGSSKAGGGKLVWPGANDSTGTTALTAGTVHLSGGNNRLPSATQLSMTGSAVLDLNGTNQTVGSLSSASTQASITLGSGTLSVN